MIKMINRIVYDEYGSRRGLLNTQIHRFKYYLGQYNHLKQVQWADIDRLVFVCKGNICRSAYAEAVAKGLGLDSASCGVDTSSGMPANQDAVRVAALRGYDLSHHATTPIQFLERRVGDLFVAMEPWHVERIESLCGGDASCTLLGMWGRPGLPYIHDPYGASDEYFNYCFGYIEKAVNEVAEKIKNS